jgi:outer membrane protein assembly factor BamB
MELEPLETQPGRRAWLAWARGLLAQRQGDAARLADARAALARAGEWIDLPDGVSLSKQEALQQLATQRSTAPERTKKAADYSHPGRLVWAFHPPKSRALLRWALDPAGSHLLVQDEYGGLFALDRSSGRLLWQKRAAQATAVPAARSLRASEELVQPLEWCLLPECAVVHRDGHLTALSWRDGALIWQAKVDGFCRLAGASGRVLCWLPESGRLDALDAVTGRQLWSRPLPEIAKKPTSTASQPQWHVADLQAQHDRALVCGSGTALVMLEDGAVLWKAAESSRALSFPLDLSAAAPMAAFSAGAPQLQVSHPLAAPILGYPGAFGSLSAGTWLQWGAQGSRWLDGDAVWLKSAGAWQQRTVLGFPEQIQATADSSIRISPNGWPLGTAGRSLIVTDSSGVHRLSPEGQITPLLSIPKGVQIFSPQHHPMPAAALDGTVVLMADAEQIQAAEAKSGTVLWQQPWQGQAAEIIKKGRAKFGAWLNLRWSSSGIALYDGQSRSLVIDWRALACEGDIIIPAGMGSLLCLRCPPQEAGGE